MADEHKLSREAFEKLKAEVDELKGPERRRIAAAIKEAKSHGDLRENAAYHEARLNQRRLEARISDLERTLQLAKIVEKAQGEEGAQMGDEVIMLDLDYDDELRIKLVSSYEADPAQGFVSISSPLGAAVLGRSSGEDVEVQTPAGSQRYRIVKVGV